MLNLASMTVRARWGFALSRFGVCQSVSCFQRNSPQLILVLSSCQQLPRAEALWDPYPELALFLHLSALAAPWTMAGTEEVAARASSPASASKVPFVTASPCLVSD